MFNKILQIDMMLVRIDLTKKEGPVVEEEKTLLKIYPSGRSSNNKLGCISLQNDPHNFGGYIAYATSV